MVLVMIPLVVFIAFVSNRFSMTNDVVQMETNELAQLLHQTDDDSYFFVDVREENEFREGHIAQMTNFPLSQFESKLEHVPIDKTIVLICRSGNRSQQAADILVDKGYRDIININGGMLAWEGKVTKWK
ncbi:rhodanese-like domain-containing protein [Desertibacillus haloalkaliphilus]|nr:rhodanese-like domain-containing protein [Desertibacillus haloalkaliphilus]